MCRLRQDDSSDSRFSKPFKSFQATQDLNFKLSAFKTTLRSTEEMTVSYMCNVALTIRNKVHKCDQVRHLAHLRT
jgi:hypothetical protein